MNAVQERLQQRELTVRVATLELLVADLVHLVRQIAPDRVDALVADALRDRDTQLAREMPAGAEHQRQRLHQVFEERCRSLKHKRVGGALTREPSD